MPELTDDYLRNQDWKRMAADSRKNIGAMRKAQGRQQRDAILAIIREPPPPPTRTPEEWEMRVTELEQQLSSANAEHVKRYGSGCAPLGPEGRKSLTAISLLREQLLIAQGHINKGMRQSELIEWTKRNPAA